MLISRVPDDGAAGERRDAMSMEPHDHSQEYQTASELFDLMAKNHAFNTNDSPLSTSDLVILYKNIDLGTRLLSATNGLKRPNQHVENVVYNDDADSDSDLSEIYSNEDMHDVFQINNEQIAFLSTPSSLDNTLCHKLGDLELQTPELATDYGNHFPFKDPYIKEQLRNITLMSNSKEIHNTVLPASLLDYICCKRLEDNYNFYMENVIRYVKHTIEQLKRISNGDFLTEKAKQKWREVERYPEKADSNKKIIATSTSIPLHVERKVHPGRNSTWDDLVHSEVDIRSLSKILEKKIFLEVPKIIFGSYRLFSKRYADNLVISCKRASSFEVKDEKRKKSRVDLVFKFKKSDSGHVVSNINSIMILQTSPHNLHESSLPDILPLPNLETEKILDKNEGNIKIVELDDQKYDAIEECSAKENLCLLLDTVYNSDSNSATNGFTSEFEYTSSSHANTSNHESGGSNVSLKDILNTKVTDTLCQDNTALNHTITPNELRLTMCKLNIQTSLPEESLEDLRKKKSTTRVRIKSPYENKSYFIEEKKRKKLLEIRERREKKKMTLNENCRIVKHKYGGKGAIIPQPKSSVTKLSISNKSFYNSIYGQTDAKEQKTKKNKKISVLNSEICSGEELNILLQPSCTNSEKHISRSFDLDDTVTEIMRMQMKKEKMGKELYSASTSAVSTDLGPHFSILSQFINHTDRECKDNPLVIRCDTDEELERTSPNVQNDVVCSKYVSDSQSADNVVPVNTPRNKLETWNPEPDERDLKNVAITVDCRKSIDKIYDLMQKFIQTDTPEKSPFTINATSTYRDSSTGHTSDSGTSLKHYRPLSNDSKFNLQNISPLTTKHVASEMTRKATTVVPKVIISNKPQIQKTDSEKLKKDRKKVVISTPKTVPDNPLRAISQLLHEFDNIKKTRQKESDVKSNKKVEAIITDNCNSCRQRSILKRSRIDHQVTNQQILRKNVNTAVLRDKKPTAPTDIPKIPHQQIPVPEKSNDKYAKKKVSDIIDEAKEARSETVRGPCKTSRLDTLAQPKRSYVQAHSEEFKKKYGRNLMTDRLQRLAETPQPPIASEKSITSSNWRMLRRAGPEIVSSVSVKQPPRSTLPLDKWRLRSSTSSSPDDNKQPPAESSCKPNHVDTPEILKNKMVAVESYVKLHYGCVSSAAARLLDPSVLPKSRNPLTPTDLDLLSVTSSPTVEESTAQGGKLYNLIDTKLNSISPSLFALSECPEHSSKLSNTDDSVGEQLSKDGGAASVDSDDNVDLFKDTNICTAIEQIEENDDSSTEVGIENDKNNYNVKPFNSAMEMDRLKNALQHKISLGNFQTLLRIKKLTLTPKQSMQQAMLLQSGDASSLIMKASLSQNLKVNLGSFKKEMSDLNEFSLLTNSHLNWNFATIPMQIATVGYTFPSYQNIQESIGERTNSGAETIKKEHHLLTNVQSDNTCRCFKGQQISLNVKDIDQFEARKSLNALNKTNKEHVLISKEEIIKKVKSVDNKNEHVSVDYNETCTDAEINTLEQPAKEKSDDIEYTNSLDMLVALLNEIQKVTTCHTLVKSDKDELHRKQLQPMLNNGDTLETVMNDPCELMSINSLGKLRQLDSNSSIYSLYLSNGKEHGPRQNETCVTPEISTAEMICYEKPVCADKEINVNIPDKLYTNMFSEVPSHLLPDTLYHSSNISSSLIGVLSTQSVPCYTDYKNVNSNALLNSQKKIIEFSYLESTKFKNALNPFEIGDQLSDENDKSSTVSQLKAIDNIAPKLKEICIPKLTKCVSKPKYYFAEAISDRIEIYEKCSDDIDKSNTILRSKVPDNVETKPKEVIKPKLITSGSKPNQYVAGVETDSIIKIKRDILVTLYSVFVLTVFAALSFPELMYHG